MSTAQAPSIRRAAAADGPAIIDIASRAARISNASDYTPEQIEALVAGFSPERVGSHIAERDVFVAVDSAGKVLGTAAYFDGYIRAFFIDPDHQGVGIGRRLIAAAEDAARQDGREVVAVRASLTAVGFYARHGYVAVRDLPDTVPTVLMEKSLVVD